MSIGDDPEATAPPPGGPPASRGRWARAGLLVVLIAAATYGAVVVGAFIPSETERALAAFTPSVDRPDPSTTIPGVTVHDVAGGEHVAATGDIVYGTRPPTGGPHGTGRPACSGVANQDPIADPDAVHGLEHGAVWITYDPTRTPPGVKAALTARVTNDSYVMLSPYPGLDAPVSLQAWGHRLVLDTPEDPRFEQFLQALRGNPYTPPEPNGDCGA